jgi:transcriptional regulator with XRE-family HTH domain
MRYKLGRCNLYDLAKEIGWSNKDLQEKLQMTRQQVHDYATNKKRMGAAMIFAVADEMGVDPRRIYELIPVRKQPRRRKQPTESTD